MTKLGSNSIDEEILDCNKRCSFENFDLGDGDFVEVAQDLVTP